MLNVTSRVWMRLKIKNLWKILIQACPWISSLFWLVWPQDNVPIFCSDPPRGWCQNNFNDTVGNSFFGESWKKSSSLPFSPFTWPFVWRAWTSSSASGSWISFESMMKMWYWNLKKHSKKHKWNFLINFLSLEATIRKQNYTYNWYLKNGLQQRKSYVNFNLKFFIKFLLCLLFLSLFLFLFLD